jgi:hypothetical protein
MVTRALPEDVPRAYNSAAATARILYTSLACGRRQILTILFALPQHSRNLAPGEELCIQKRTHHRVARP